MQDDVKSMHPQSLQEIDQALCFDWFYPSDGLEKMWVRIADQKLAIKAQELIQSAEAKAYKKSWEEERERVKGLVAGMKRLRKPTHGTCCTCQTCGYDNDNDCECPRNKVLSDISLTVEKGEE